MGCSGGISASRPSDARPEQGRTTPLRPEILFPLFAPVTSLKGIGQRFGKLVERAAGPRLVDLLWAKPAGVIDRRFSPKLRDAPPGQIATLTVHVDQHLPPGNARQPYRVRCSDETGHITLTFFRARGDWIEKVLPLGSIRVISGKVESYGDQLQMSHPDHMAPGRGGARDRAGLWADCRPVAQDDAAGRAGRAGPRPCPARMAGSGLHRPPAVADLDHGDRDPAQSDDA